MAAPAPKRTLDPPAWLAPWIGLPYGDFGRGPETFDCWGLAREAAGRVFAIDVPSYDGAYDDCGPNEDLDALFARESAGWTRIAAAERGGQLVRTATEAPGDFVLMRHGRLNAHVGLVAGGLWMLHIQERMASIVERYDQPPWGNKVVGIYRHRASAERLAG